MQVYLDLWLCVYSVPKEQGLSESSMAFSSRKMPSLSHLDASWLAPVTSDPRMNVSRNFQRGHRRLFRVVWFDTVVR